MPKNEVSLALIDKMYEISTKNYIKSGFSIPGLQLQGENPGIDITSFSTPEPFQLMGTILELM
jgi:hypothetical protein